jgi:hypothetical protein
VIEGADLKRWRPRVILVETSWHEQWEPIILAADYLFATFDGLNRCYVRCEDRHLLKALGAPVNACDRYVDYHHKLVIDQLNAQLIESRKMAEDLANRASLGCDLELDTLRIAAKLRRIRARHPRLFWAAKRIVRLAS